MSDLWLGRVGSLLLACLTFVTIRPLFLSFPDTEIPASAFNSSFCSRSLSVTRPSPKREPPETQSRFPG
jgi:hypothetical protein